MSLSESINIVMLFAFY